MEEPSWMMWTCHMEEPRWMMWTCHMEEPRWMITLEVVSSALSDNVVSNITVGINLRFAPFLPTGLGSWDPSSWGPLDSWVSVDALAWGSLDLLPRGFLNSVAFVFFALSSFVKSVSTF